MGAYLLFGCNQHSCISKKANQQKGNEYFDGLFATCFCPILFGYIGVLDKNSDTMINMTEPNREAVGALLAASWVYWTSRRQ